MRVWTWNANRKSHLDLPTILAELDKRLNWDVIAMQEIGSKLITDEIITTPAGHFVYVSSTRAGSLSTGVAVHRSMAHTVSHYLHGERFSVVDLKAEQGTDKRLLDIRILSVHLPSDVAYGRRAQADTAAEYLDTILRHIQDQTKGKRAMTILCGDLNAELATTSNRGDHAGRALHRGQGHRYKEHDEMILNNLMGMNLKVLNTYSEWWKDRQKVGKEHDYGYRDDDNTTDHSDGDSVQTTSDDEEGEHANDFDKDALEWDRLEHFESQTRDWSHREEDSTAEDLMRFDTIDHDEPG